MLTPDEAQEQLNRISYKKGFKLTLSFLWDDFAVLAIDTKVVDSETDKRYNTGIKRIIELNRLDKSTFIRAVYITLNGWEQHECQEFFKVDGVPVYNPHTDIEKLVEING